MRKSLAAIVLVAVGLSSLGQGLFPGLPYPGGYTLLRYEIRSGAEPPSTWTIEVVPRDGRYEVGFSVSRSVPSQGFSLLGGWMQVAFPKAMEAVFPIFSLWGREIEPGKTYILRDRARLVTEDQRTFLGIPVVVARLLHPRFPDLKVTVYVPEPSHQPFLPFPPYVLVEERSGEGYSALLEIKLVEFVHEGP